MACGSKPDEVKPPLPQTPPPQPILPTRGPVRVPISSQSSLVYRGTRLFPPGYVGYRAPFQPKGIGSRELEAIGRAHPAGSSGPKGVDPVASRSILQLPGKVPSTSQPNHLADVDRGRYFRARFPIRPGLGDARPVSTTGEVRYLAPGWPGGMALPLPMTYEGIGDKGQMPFDQFSRERWVAFNANVRQARLDMKRPIMLLAGPSAREFAQAPRIKPNTPGFFQGAGPQEPLRPTTMRGRLNDQDRAPTPILDAMAREAAQFGSLR